MQFSKFLSSLLVIASFSSMGSAHPIVRTHKRELVRRVSGQCMPKSSATSTASASSESASPTMDVSQSTSSSQPSSTPSSKAPKSKSNTNSDSTSSSSSSSSSKSGLFALFPLTASSSKMSPDISSGSSNNEWSVSSLFSSPLPLSDDTLGSFNIEKRLSYSYGSAPDGVDSLEITYPEGTAALTGNDTPPGGVSFYAPGPSSVDLSNAKEVTFGYSVLFEDGFKFNMGGKLPGVYGGDDAQGSITCSGGRHSNACFSARFMWRTDGAGESYVYLPSADQFPANKKQCSAVPGSSCNNAYGNSIGRGLFKFTPGVRSTITQRVRLNDAGQSNGALQVWQDGESIFNLEGIVLRQSDAGRIRGIQMQSFFGGHGSQWASPKTQKSYLGDFSLAITETL